MVDSIGLCLLVAVGLRLGAWLVEPVLPMLGTLLIVALMGMWLFGRHGPRAGGYR